jgi:hypothetical protein
VLFIELIVLEMLMKRNNKKVEKSSKKSRIFAKICNFPSFKHEFLIERAKKQRLLEDRRSCPNE